MTSRLTLLSALLLVMGAGGCTKGNPSPDDLAGLWIITKESRATLPLESRRASGKLILSKNGDFVADGLPGELIPPSQTVNNSLPLSAKGTWKLHKVDGETALLLTFAVITSPPGYSPPSGGQISIDSGWRETTLYFFLGDPDLGRRVEFELSK